MMRWSGIITDHMSELVKLIEMGILALSLEKFCWTLHSFSKVAVGWS